VKSGKLKVKLQRFGFAETYFKFSLRENTFISLFTLKIESTRSFKERQIPD